jgi:elongation factor 1-beta
MAKVALELRVLPKDVNVNMEKLEKEIMEKIKPEKISKRPIAFGLECVLLIKIVEDAEGEVEKVENSLKEIRDIGQIEVTRISRTLNSKTLC